MKTILVMLLVFVALEGRSLAQVGEPSPPAYTLRAQARVVLTDVTVTDEHGLPIAGLSPESFRLFDNGQEQRISSFTEHRGAEIEPWHEPALPAGVSSNEFLLHLPSVVNVVVLDMAGLRWQEIAQLKQELIEGFSQLPAAQPIAIFLMNGGSFLLVQNFTADRATLVQAVRRILPPERPADQHIGTPGVASFGESQALHKIALYLSGIRGRKNVLWFSGGSALAFSPELTAAVSAGMRPVYNELEAARISLYPVDARGLTLAGLNPLADSILNLQFQIMENEAEATGGTAQRDRNRLGLEMARTLEHDRSFYTLTYTPPGDPSDGRWHDIRVKVDRRLVRLSYRHGYFADPVDRDDSMPEQKPRLRLMPDGKPVSLQGDLRAPLLFRVRLDQDKSSGRMELSYTVAARELTWDGNGSGKVAKIDLLTQLLDRSGRELGHKADEFTFSVAAQEPGAESPLYAIQHLAGAADAAYMVVAVWDPVSRRRGVLEVPLPDQTGFVFAAKRK